MMHVRLMGEHQAANLSQSPVNILNQIVRACSEHKEHLKGVSLYPGVHERHHEGL